MNNDIEQRAEKALEKVKESSKGKGLSFDEEVNRYGGYIVGFKDAMTEERERGKRFGLWMYKNNLTFVNDDIFNSFLAEEKALNN